MASASQRSISRIRHAPVMLIAAPPGPRTSTRGDGARLLRWREDCSVCLRNRPCGRLHGMPGLWIDRLVPGTVRTHQGAEAMVVVVVVALRRLRAEDERMAGDAEAALGSLMWDRGAGHHPARAAG